MNNVSNLQDPPKKNKRPRVTSVRVRTKPGIDLVLEELPTITYETIGQEYSEYAESLPFITAITISQEERGVSIPVSAYIPISSRQGFMQSISENIVEELSTLGDDITVNITFGTENVPMVID